jgi:tRNA G10  N-methylase Trm11
MLTSKPNYVFIPGKNWRLSLAEIATFFEARNIRFKVDSFSKEFFAVNIEENGCALTVADLGGIIKIGTINKNFETELLGEAFCQKNKQAKILLDKELTQNSLVDGMLEKASGKYLFGVSVYCAEESLCHFSKSIQRFAGSSIKKALAAHGRKSEFMGFAKNRKQPQLTHVEVLKKGLVENKAEGLLCIGRKQTWLATTVAVHNPFEFQKRDVGKPNQRKIFAIPPRLARIMINFAQCMPGKVFLDPFCGVGTILQEALLTRAEVIGVDLNPWCVKAAGENLEWLKHEYELPKAEYRVLKGDARSLTSRTGEVDCIATEPDLGPALRDVPTTPYAGKIVNKLEPLFVSFLAEAFKILRENGRLVLVTPYFRSRSGKVVTMPIGEKALELGFEIVRPFKEEIFVESNAAKNLTGAESIVEVAERHITGREIHIFQK